MAKETLRCEWVRCGKGCGGCPHGPYWYAYWREEKKLRKRYIGKGDPRAERKEEARTDGAASTSSTARPHPDDAILNERTASPYLARRILGVAAGAFWEEVGLAYKKLCKRYHPDTNPDADPRIFTRVQAAYAYLRKLQA